LQLFFLLTTHYRYRYSLPVMNELMTTTEVAQLLGVSRQMVGRWARGGLIPYQAIGSGQRCRILITRADALAFVRPTRGPRPNTD
jgi:excisionase family DNA binding protein